MVMILTAVAIALNFDVLVTAWVNPETYRPEFHRSCQILKPASAVQNQLNQISRIGYAQLFRQPDRHR